MDYDDDYNDDAMDYDDDYNGDEDWLFWDICYECQGYGDDYYINECGELECHCDDCSFSDPWDD